jgi:hypothetical protein
MILRLTVYSIICLGIWLDTGFVSNVVFTFIWIMSLLTCWLATEIILDSRESTRLRLQLAARSRRIVIIFRFLDVPIVVLLAHSEWWTTFGIFLLQALLKIIAEEHMRQ